jgi:branched-chain amino acid transport system substrate-binding protein
LLARPLAACCLLPAVVMAVTGCGGGGGGGGATKKISSTNLTVYSSLPEQGAAKDQAKAMEDGAALALAQRGGKVGKYTITFKRLDDSLASTGAADEGKGAQNARTAVQNKNTIGYIGEYNSGISKVTIPINNKGGIPQISPANTYVGLTSTAPGHAPGEPDKYYPTGKRNYVRVVPKDTVQSAALATAMKQDGCKNIHIFNSKTVYSAGLAKNITSVAPKVGLKVEGSSAYDPKSANYRSLVSNVKADCVVQTGELESNGAQLLKDVAAANTSAKIYGSDGICLNAAANPKKGVPTVIAPRYECTIATLDPAKFGPAGKKFFADFSAKYHEAHPDTYAIYGYESMNLLLDAIKKASASGSLTRQKVIDQLLATRNRSSVIGTYSINKNGDTSLTTYGLRNIKGTQLNFLRVLKPSPSLIPPG